MNGAVGHPMFGLRGEGRYVRNWDLGVAHLLTGEGGRHPDLGLIEMYSKSVFQEPGGALTYRAREVCTPVPFHRVPVHSEKQMGEMVRDSACKELINKNLTSVFTDQCTMLPLSTKSCLKWSKLRPILNGKFCHAISKNIGLNVLGSKQLREILVFAILKL